MRTSAFPGRFFFRRWVASLTRGFYRLPCSLNRSGQSGRGADDPRERVTAGSAPSKAAVEQVHALLTYHREVLRRPVRALAAEIGISKSAVERFHKERPHPGKLWPRLRDWYIQMRQTQAREAYQTPPQLLVDSMLLGIEQLPSSQRSHALRVLAETWRSLYAESKTPPAEWVQRLADLAEHDSES